MLYVGLLLGVVTGNFAAHAAGLDAGRVYVATLILILPALAGARLLYVTAEWRHYGKDFRRVWDRRDGGYIMYGGLPLALLFSVPVLRILDLNFGAFWDVAVFTILVGMFFTRIGCLLNGCCAGRPSSSWIARRLPNPRGTWTKRIPTQAMESTVAAVLAVSAAALRHSVPFPGALFLLVSLGYASARLAMEPFRERERQASRLSIAYFLSLLITVLSFSALAIYWNK